MSLTLTSFEQVEKSKKCLSNPTVIDLVTACCNLIKPLYKFVHKPLFAFAAPEKSLFLLSQWHANYY
jgi:hypothetical protein